MYENDLQLQVQLNRTMEAMEAQCVNVDSCAETLVAVESNIERFNTTLGKMQTVAEAYESGLIGDDEFSIQFMPAAEALKAMATEMGLATEGSILSDDDVNRISSYMNQVHAALESRQEVLAGVEAYGLEGYVSAFESEIEPMLSAMESTFGGDAALEGATTEAENVLSRIKKDIKASEKQMKDAAKKKNWSEAAKYANEAAGHANRMANELNNINGTVGSTICGWIAWCVITSVISMSVAMAIMVGGTVSGALKGAKIDPVGGAEFGMLTGSMVSLPAASLAGQVTTLIAAIRNLIKICKTKEILDADGNPVARQNDVNDLNPIIANCKDVAKKNQIRLQAMAKAYQQKAKESGTSGASESFDDVGDYLSMLPFMKGMEGQEIAYTTFDYCMEGYLDSVETDIAMEGAGSDAASATHAAIKNIRSIRKEMKAAEKAKDYKLAAKKAKEAAKAAGALSKSLNGLNQDTKSAVVVSIAISIVALMAAAAVGAVIGHAVGARAGANAAEKAVQTQSGFDARYNSDLQKEGIIGGTRSAKTSAVFSHNGAKDMDQLKLIYRAKARTEGAAVGGAKGAVKGGLAGAGVGAAAGGTLNKLLRSKKVVDANGNKTKVELQPNDVNAVIAACKAEAAKLQKRYEEIAAAYSSKASGKANESFENDPLSDEYQGSGAYEGYEEDPLSDGYDPATESAADVPYLFD